MTGYLLVMFVCMGMNSDGTHNCESGLYGTYLSFEECEQEAYRHGDDLFEAGAEVKSAACNRIQLPTMA